MKTKLIIPAVAFSMGVISLLAPNMMAQSSPLTMDLTTTDSAKQNQDSDLFAWTAGTSQTVNSLDPSNFGAVWGLKTSAFTDFGSPASFSIYDLTTSQYLIQDYSLAGQNGNSAIYGTDLVNLPKEYTDTLQFQWNTSESGFTKNATVEFVIDSALQSAPGAPAPPLTACLAFAGVLLLQAFKSRTTKA